MSDFLTDKELKIKMKRIPNWEQEGKTITRTVLFEDYIEGIEFVNDVAEIAADVDHYPDIDVRFGKVVLRCSTSRVKAVTEEDITLALRIDNLID